MLRYGLDAGDVVTGLAGMCFLGSFFAAAAWVICYRFDASFEVTPKDEVGSASVGTLAKVKAWMSSAGEWKDTGSGYRRHYRHLFADYRFGMQWYFLLDLLFSLSLGALDGTRPQLRSGCNAVSYAAATILLGALATAWLLHPYSAPLNQLYAVVSSGLAFGSAAFVVLGNLSSSDTLTNIGEYLSLWALLLSIVKTLFDLFHLGRTLWKWTRIQVHNRRQRFDLENGAALLQVEPPVGNSRAPEVEAAPDDVFVLATREEERDTLLAALLDAAPTTVVSDRPQEFQEPEQQDPEQQAAPAAESLLDGLLDGGGEPNPLGQELDAEGFAPAAQNNLDEEIELLLGDAALRPHSGDGTERSNNPLEEEIKATAEKLEGEEECVAGVPSATELGPDDAVEFSPPASAALDEGRMPEQLDTAILESDL